MSDPETHDRADEDPEKGKLIAFPSEPAEPAAPLDVEEVKRFRVDLSLKKYLTIAVVVLVLVFAGHVIYTLIQANSRAEGPKAGAYSNTEFREVGAITYGDKIVQGWYLDPSHEHFMAEDGRKFTFVNSHQRKDSTVIGYWRIIE